MSTSLSRESFVELVDKDSLAAVVSGIVYDMVRREIAPEGKAIQEVVDARMKLWPDVISEAILCYVEDLEEEDIVTDEDVITYVTKTFGVLPEFCTIDVLMTCISSYRELIKIQADVINVMQKAMHAAETALKNEQDKINEFNTIAETIWREENDIPDEAG